MPEVVGNDRNCLTLSSCQIEEDHGRPTWFFGGWRWGILRNFNYSKLPGFQALNWWCVVLEKSNPHFQVLKVNVPDYLILGCFKNSFPKHAKLHAEELGTWKTAVYLGCWEIYNMGRGGVPDAITWRTFHFAFTKVGHGDRGLRILASWRWYEGTPAQKNHWMQWCRGPPFLRCKHKGAPMFFLKKIVNQPTQKTSNQPIGPIGQTQPPTIAGLSVSHPSCNGALHLPGGMSTNPAIRRHCQGHPAGSIGHMTSDPGPRGPKWCSKMRLRLGTGDWWVSTWRYRWFYVCFCLAPSDFFCEQN